MNPEETVELRLTGLAYGGEAVGRLPDGRAVFIPYALPDETVRARIKETRKGFARAELIEVMQPSARRIAPCCPHFGVCGGCQYQMLAYPDQLEAKTGILRDQLARIGGLREVNVLPIVASPAEWNYRNNVQFHLDETGRLGYQAANSHIVVPIQACYLPEPPLDEIWPLLDFEAHTGLQRVALRRGAEGDAMLILESVSDEAPEFSIDFPMSAVFMGPAGTIVLAGDEALRMEALGKGFRVSPPSFFQINTAQAEAMVRYLLEKLPTRPDAVALDVFSGVGLFSAFLAPRVSRLIGVELSPSACDDYAVNLDEYDHVELYAGAAEEVLPGLEVKPDFAVVDPPRTGLERRALDALTAMAPQTIAYVSCDPSTLARDAKRLTAAGYTLAEITPFDLFPQTYSLESVSIFERIK
jgi:23S rRNA (uracil1939-C5)-methyltransferase